MTNSAHKTNVQNKNHPIWMGKLSCRRNGTRKKTPYSEVFFIIRHRASFPLKAV